MRGSPHSEGSIGSGRMSTDLRPLIAWLNILYKFTIFHDDLNTVSILQNAHIAKHISIHDQQIGQFTYFYGAQFVETPHGICTVSRYTLDRLAWSKSKLHEVPKFFSVPTMRKERAVVVAR